MNVMPVETKYLNTRLVGILRTKPGTLAEHAIQAIQTAFQVGAEAVEITSNSDHWQKVVDVCVKKGFNIGVGSIKTKELTEEAINCGARFLVSPGFFEDVVQVAKEHRIPILPGVYTNDDLELEKKYGIGDQKFFPCNALTHEEFYKAVKEPFRDEFEELKQLGIEILTYDPMKEYKDAIYIDSPTKFYEIYLSVKSHSLAPNTKCLILKLPDGSTGFDRLKEFAEKSREYGIHTYAVGGINNKNMKEVLTRYGAYGVCPGSGMFNSEAIFNGDFDTVEQDVKRHVSVVKEVFAGKI